MQEAKLAKTIQTADSGLGVGGPAPEFPCVPTRWLVVRTIKDKASVEPQSAWNDGLAEVTGWVVESDRRWELEELQEDIDLQIDVSPFISAETADVSLQDQAKVFIGRKKEGLDWYEDNKAKRIPKFKLMLSSNQLFADYQPHCSNVFSIVDNFTYAREKQLSKAKANYSVIGWHSEKSGDIFSPAIKRTERLDALQAQIKGNYSVPGLSEAYKEWLDANAPTRTVCHGAMYDVERESFSKPVKVPADDFCDHINSTLPIAVGTSPMDALIAYARSHADLDHGVPGDLEKQLVKLEKFLLARDDGVEAPQWAADMLYDWNF